MSLQLSNSQLFGGYFFQNPSALGDTVDFTANLTPGDYRLTFFGAQTTPSGIQDVFLNGDLVATFDHYFAPGTNFNAKGSVLVTVAQSANVVRSVIVGQNPSSVGFNALISRVYFSPV